MATRCVYGLRALPLLSPHARTRVAEILPSYATVVGARSTSPQEQAHCKQRGPVPLRATSAPLDVGAFISQNGSTLGWVAAAVVIFVAVFKLLEQGSRKYDGNVGDEYDAWTREGILEHYWGEHIHLGYYTDEDRQPGFFSWGKKDFKQVCGSPSCTDTVRYHANSLSHEPCQLSWNQCDVQAKYDFVDEMLKWSGATDPKSILDVGCGFGGTSRSLASKFPDAAVQGITLSPEQVKRGSELAEERCFPPFNQPPFALIAMSSVCPPCCMKTWSLCDTPNLKGAVYPPYPAIFDWLLLHG